MSIPVHDSAFTNVSKMPLEAQKGIFYWTVLDEMP
ncbi:hypothetical protein CLV58_11393 [Spirosoma oryzae]|uniref:Uncharacterized protein n=1 Tax=Spirosoma oryzae TaxID=1469603 RepID=A0A2T0SRC1_9BACT|nr:hypothetical protein CLV58_11393 [Spirosoma oryzae]